MPAVQSEIDSLLQSFVRMNSPDVIGAALATKRGLPISIVAPGEIDPKMFSAQLAAIISAQNRVAKYLRLGEMIQSTLETKDGILVTKLAGGGFIVGLIAAKDANLGLLLVHIEELASRIGQIMAKDELAGWSE